MTHWQHLALTGEAISEADRVWNEGLSSGDKRFLLWLQSRGAVTVTASTVARQFLGADPDPRRGHGEFVRAKALLESLALLGYLFRGRKSTTIQTKEEPQDFAFTTYRLSSKAKALLSTQAL